MRYYSIWMITLILLFFCSLGIFLKGLDSGIGWKIFYYISSFSLFVVLLLLSVIMTFIFINGTIKFDDNFIYIKDIHKKPLNPLNFEYRRIPYFDIENIKQVRAYKQSMFILTLTNGDRYEIGRKIFHDYQFDKFINTIEKYWK